MSNNFGFIDIILLAMIAGFIILRLRNILGRKTGHEGKNASTFEDKKYTQFKPEIKNKPILKDVLEDNEKKEFLRGAEIAYENIITSFAKGEKGKLKTLLTKEIYINFEQAIDHRNKEDIESELTFIGVKESSVEKFEKKNHEFVATVKIVSEIISIKKDKNKTIIEGDPDKIKTVTDYWKFSKNVSSKNPNWFLAEIISK
ncbi:MAG: putative lipid-binding transport protein, Tim44 family [Pelagibacterales bacterium]|mgnify:FL=1|nr:putative lipid-binding transport protein, Tim44 family [Pelagibacterales bacterium]|tara:strand:- start:1286 stop:1888 length:603 start_codon:yes stop_codon:yes gene_type:complete